MKVRTCEECGVTTSTVGLPNGQEHQVTKSKKRMVFELIRSGHNHKDTARCMEISDNTLRKYYREEIDTAKTLGTTSVANALFKMATRGRNAAAAIFWMKAQAGWSETLRIDMGDNAIEEYDLSKLSDDELAFFEALQRKAQVNEDGDTRTDNREPLH